MGLLRDVAKKSTVVIKLNSYRRFWQLRKEYLAENGSFNSFPSDSAGQAIPWYSYPAVAFLKDVIQKQWRVFEYGCGYSMIFWNQHCERTVSVEHDELWFNRLDHSSVFQESQFSSERSHEEGTGKWRAWMVVSYEERIHQ
jgi:hypothetical protein